MKTCATIPWAHKSPEPRGCVWLRWSSYNITVSYQQNNAQKLARSSADSKRHSFSFDLSWHHRWHFSSCLILWGIPVEWVLILSLTQTCVRHCFVKALQGWLAPSVTVAKCFLLQRHSESGRKLLKVLTEWQSDCRCDLVLQLQDRNTVKQIWCITAWHWRCCTFCNSKRGDNTVVRTMLPYTGVFLNKWEERGDDRAKAHLCKTHHQWLNHQDANLDDRVWVLLRSFVQKIHSSLQMCSESILAKAPCCLLNWCFFKIVSCLVWNFWVQSGLSCRKEMEIEIDSLLPVSSWGSFEQRICSETVWMVDQKGPQWAATTWQSRNCAAQSISSNRLCLSTHAVQGAPRNRVFSKSAMPPICSPHNHWCPTKCWIAADEHVSLKNAKATLCWSKRVSRSVSQHLTRSQAKVPLLAGQAVATLMMMTLMVVLAMFVLLRATTKVFWLSKSWWRQQRPEQLWQWWAIARIFSQKPAIFESNTVTSCLCLAASSYDELASTIPKVAGAWIQGFCQPWIQESKQIDNPRASGELAGRIVAPQRNWNMVLDESNTHWYCRRRRHSSTTLIL